MMSDAKPSPWAAKVDARLQALIVRAEGRAEEAGQSVNVFVRFSGDAESLRMQGVLVRAVTGDIATASVMLSDIPRIASLPEILFMELSRQPGANFSSPAEDQADASRATGITP